MAFQMKTLPRRWNIVIQYSQFLYLACYTTAVICCSFYFVSPPKYMMANKASIKALKLDFGDEAKYPKCNLGLEKSGKSITTIFEDFILPDSQECRFFQEIFHEFYLLRVTSSPLQLYPQEFLQKMKTWMQNRTDLLDQVTDQKIVRITNRFTGEETLINSIRDKRPVPESSSVQSYLDNLIKSSRQDCDFCDYKKNTAIDVFGRLETQHSYTMTNAFKLDQHHSMVVFRSHDPVNWNYTQFIDAFDLAQLWFKEVKRFDPRCIYRHIYWDMFPKAGGSQIHPHIHMTANSQGFHGSLASLVSAATEYNNKNSSRNYYEDLIYLHNQLGLVTMEGQAAVVAHINPRKDNELLIMAPEYDSDFYKLLYAAIRVYFDEMKLYPFSMAISFPTEESSWSTPVVARVATRGDISEHRSDVSSLELFSASNVNSDPVNIARRLRRYVKKFTADLDFS